MARRLADPAYAADVHDQDAFARETLELHRRTTSAAASGRLQLPWPRALGTPPWAVARELGRLTGADCSTHVVRLGGAWQHLVAATPRRPAVVYVGDRLSPRHVVLVAEVADDAAWTYEPASGVMTPVGRRRWQDGSLRLAGWDHAWLVVAPDQPISSA